MDFENTDLPALCRMLRDPESMYAAGHSLAEEAACRLEDMAKGISEERRAHEAAVMVTVSKWKGEVEEATAAADRMKDELMALRPYAEAMERRAVGLRNHLMAMVKWCELACEQIPWTRENAGAIWHSMDLATACHDAALAETRHEIGQPVRGALSDCPTCLGTGYTGGFGKDKCARCSGFGHVSSLPPPEPISECHAVRTLRCKDCDGDFEPEFPDETPKVCPRCREAQSGVPL